METRFKKEMESFKKLGFLNQYNFSDAELLLLPIKYHVRAVIVLENGRIILVKAEHGKYHSIVGGEVDDGEDLETAIIRESKEESGYDIEIINRIGCLEYCGKKNKKFDFGFIAKAIGMPNPLSLTEREIELGHEVYEYTIDESVSILENEIRTMKSPVSERSLVFLKEAKKYQENQKNSA